MPLAAEFRLRRATPDDATRLGAVHVAAWREAYVGMVPDSVLVALDPRERAAMWQRTIALGGIAWLAELDGALHGFGSCGGQPDASVPCSAEIHAIYVLQRAQRLGIGQALMAAMARDLWARGHPSASLWVLEANTRARRFYERLGGRVLLRREQQRQGFTAFGVAYGWDDLSRLF